jgi:hypothetical protein
MKILKGMVYPDIHFPIHDERGYNLVNKFAYYFKPDLFVNLGYICHFNGISHWNGSRIKVRVEYPIKKEFDLAYNHHKIQREVNKKAKIYSLGGNHDQTWLESYLDSNPELVGYIDFKKSMGITDFDVNYIPIEKQPLKLGKLNFIHGWYCNIHHSKKTAELANRSIIYGHTHDYQSCTSQNLYSSDRKISVSLGHLSDESKASYLRKRPTNWLLMFGIFYLNSEDGSFTVYPIPIPKYKFYWEGKKFEG